MSRFLLWKDRVTVTGDTQSQRIFSRNCLDFFFQNVFKLKNFALSSVQTSKSEEEIFKELNLDLKSNRKGFQNTRKILRFINGLYADAKEKQLGWAQDL